MRNEQARSGEMPRRNAAERASMCWMIRVEGDREELHKQRRAPKNVQVQNEALGR
jgi:hypothetical protein